MNEGRTISFTLGGLAFEYDEQKNQINIKKHGISFKSAARIFFDYDRIDYATMSIVKAKYDMIP